MSKLVTVKALGDSVPPPVQLQAVMQLQQEMTSLTRRVQTLANSLALLGETAGDLVASSRQQALDLSVLIEPLPEALSQIQQAQKSQDLRLVAMEKQLAILVAALPKLASRRQLDEGLKGLPLQLWEAKPKLFR